MRLRRIEQTYVHWLIAFRFFAHARPSFEAAVLRLVENFRESEPLAGLVPGHFNHRLI